MPGLAPGGKDCLPDTGGFRRSLLAWYDGNRRALPWRAGRGETPDPYRVWLSEIMLQQTTVAAVIPYFLNFIEKWPTVHALAAADLADVMAAWAGLGYYARARNLHKCAVEVSRKLGGAFPDTLPALKALPGIGDYTAAAVTSIAFDRPATVVDGNVERVVARYFAVTEPLPAAKKPVKEHAARLSEGRTDRPGDFAQAMMDLGAGVCIPKAPRCGLCPLSGGCEGRKRGIHSELPRRAAGRDKPRKYGYVYWLENEKGQVLFERRPEDRMLGGMPGLPTGEWVTDKKAVKDPDFLSTLCFKSEKHVSIKHTFTHFDLELTGRFSTLERTPDAVFGEWIWVDREAVPALGVPSLFKKFIRLIL